METDRAERTARRLLGVASVLAIGASAILIVDFMIKQQIVRKAEEVNRALVGASGPDGVAGTGPGDHLVGDVDDAEPGDQGDDAREDASLIVG